MTYTLPMPRSLSYGLPYYYYVTAPANSEGLNGYVT